MINNNHVSKTETQTIIHKYKKKHFDMSLYKARILYEKGVIPKLAKYFGVSEHTVRNALRFVTEGEQPEAIRNEALKN